jgi:hypothetical protein
LLLPCRYNWVRNILTDVKMLSSLPQSQCMINKILVNKLCHEHGRKQLNDLKIGLNILRYIFLDQFPSRS